MDYNEFKQNFLPEFLNIKSYAGRMQYSKEHLPRIGAGTGRIVFDIDGEKVLKLAKNVKGVAQNEVEASTGIYRDAQDIVTIVFESAENDTWLVAEKAEKVTEARIKELTEIPSLDELRTYLLNFVSSNNGKGKSIPQTREMEEFFWENEFAMELQNFVANYSQSPGDMGKSSTFGEVNRNGESYIVLTDYGINDDVLKSYYTEGKLNEYFQDASGNDDFLSDIGGGQEIRNGITALEPATVGDNDGSLNEVFPRDTGDAVAAEIGKNLGVNPQYLGAGSIGVAYDIGDDKVLKITMDSTEAYENKKLIGKELNYIAEPYRVFQIKSKSKPNMPMYGIVLEKLKTDDSYFKRMMERLEYVFRSIFRVSMRDAIREYSDNKFHQIDTNDVDNYFKKNPKDGEFFFSLLRIAQELKKYGISTYDYFNYLNLGYKKSGLIGFFDVGFTGAEKQNVDSEKINVAEDATAKFSTDGDIGSDGFPVYNNNDTSPMISNDLNANSSMYNEDLEYNHVKGDATDDEYMLGEEVISYSSDGDYDDEGDYDLDDIMNQIDNIVRKSGINILSDKELSGYVLKDNVVAGAIFSSVGNDEYSFDVVVDDNFKRMGIGKELIQFGIDEFNDLSDVYEDLKLNLDVVNPYMRDLLKKYFNFKDVNKIGDDRYNMSMNERDKSFGSGSKTVKVKKKCKIGGLGNTSAACNQGDINNLEFGSIKEDNGDDSDLLGFSTINEVVAKSEEDVENFISNSKVKETVYHGSPVGNLEDIGLRKGAVVSSGLKEEGIYFTSNRNLADEYRKGRVLTPEYKQEIELQMKKVSDMLNIVRNNREYYQYEAEYRRLQKKLRGEVYGVKLKITNPLIFDAKGKTGATGWDELAIDLGYKHARGREAVNMIGEKNSVAKDYWKYDGIIAKNMDDRHSYEADSDKIGDVYVVFDESQILIVKPELMNQEVNVGENLELPENSGIIAPMNEEGNIMQLNDLPFKSAIEQEGGKIYSVGGAVRDEYLGKESKDLDILITGIPMDRLEFLLSKFGSVNEVGASFGVLKFVPEGSREEIDIAIPRTEVANAEGGHQGFDVTSDHNLPIEKDLERRDFTINAIGKDAEGNIIDPYNGQEDLKNKIIRVVNPDAFSDDPLRMLRAVQFASRFGFEIEPKTAQMIKDNAGRVKEISPERILIEFDKIVKKGDAYKGAYLLKALGLTPQIFGKDGGLFVSDVWDGVERMSEFIWLLSHHLVGNVAEFFKTGLKGDTDSYKELKALKFAYDAAEESDIVKRRTAMHNVFVTSNAMLGSKILPESLRVAANELMTGRYPKTLGELAINGNDLMNRGLKGKEIGDMLKYLLVQIYSDNVDNNEKELSTLIDKKNKSIQEGYGDYYMSKPTWRINDKIVGINFFVEEYDKWNNQNGTPAYPYATRASVLEFLQNNYEDESTNEDINKMLYWALTDRDVLNEDGEEMKKVNYSAVVLDDSSRTKLLQLFKPMIPEGWEVIAHHMTIKLGALEVGSDAEKDMASGKVINLKAIDYAYDDLVMAVGVEGYETKNQKPHITIAVNREAGGKPYLSNKLKDWKSLGFNLELTGKISEE